MLEKKKNQISEHQEVINLREEYENEYSSKEENTIKVGSEFVKYSKWSLFKYSTKIREEYERINIDKYLEDMISNIQKYKNINPAHIKIFFKLLNEENQIITNDEYFDLIKLAKYFQVNPLYKALNKYAITHKNDIDFIISIIINEEEERTNESKEYSKTTIFNENIEEENENENENRKELESILINNINEFMKNCNIEKVSFSTIYRIIEGSSKKYIDSNELFEFIKKKENERYILYSFLKIKELNDNNYSKLYKDYERTRGTSKSIYYDYLKQELTYINELRKHQEELLTRISTLEKQVQATHLENEEISHKYSELETKMKRITTRKEELEKENTEIYNKNKQLEERISTLENQFEEKTRINNEISQKYSELETKMKRITTRKEELEKENTEIYNKNKQLEERIENINRENERLKKDNTIIKKNNSELQNKIQEYEIKQKEYIQHKSFLKIDTPTTNQFGGIFKYFQTHNNINDELKITASSSCGYKINDILKYDNIRSFFQTYDKPNSWICFEFKKHQIIPFSYIIRTIDDEDNYHLKSWVVEVSNDKQEWLTIDEHQNDSSLKGTSRIHLFKISKHFDNDSFKYIRIRQTGPNWYNEDDRSHYLLIGCIDIYGTLI